MYPHISKVRRFEITVSRFRTLFKSLETQYIVGVFYNVKNGLSFITSKSSSKNLSNENKNWWKRGNIVCLFSFLRFFEKLFDVMNDGPFLTL